MVVPSVCALLLLATSAWASSSPATLRTSGLQTTGFWSVNGVAPHDGLGFAVAAAGDVNADGYSDVLVSTNASTAGNDAVYLFFGSATGLVTPAAWSKEDFTREPRIAAAGDVNGDGYDDVIFGFAELPPTPAGGLVEVRHGHPWGLNNTPEFTATFPGTSGGYSVASAGDVNGDGYDDVVVGDPGWGPSDPCSGNERGRVNAFYGSSTGLSLASHWFKCAFSADGARVGFSVAGAGDLNGDGYDDIATTSPFAYSSGQGYGWIYCGSAGGLPANFPCRIFTGPLATSVDWGYVVAPAGDVNGDGRADLIVTDPASTAAPSGAGVVYVYVGDPTLIIPINTMTLEGIPFWTQLGTQVNEGLGTSAFTGGDINGDGLADVIAGAPRYSSPEALEGRLSAYLSVRTTMASLQPAIEANDPAAQLGASACAAGDVNGDGFGDVVVGLPGANAGLGQVRVYYGAAEKPASTASATRFAGQQSAVAGWSVAVGDVNGDGFDDLLMGVPNGDVNGSNDGWVALYLGKYAGLSASPDWVAAGPSIGANLGISAAMGQDVNGDGFGDIVVGAHLHAGTGSVVVWHGRSIWAGSSTTPNLVIPGFQGDSQFGASVAFAGDTHGDGYADVVVGAPAEDVSGLQDAGRAYLYRGASGGLVSLPSWSSSGSQSDERRGVVAGAGDVNHDGYSDVVVGAPGFDAPGPLADAGRAFVYLGTPTGLSSTHQREWVGEASSNAFGNSVAGVGDVDGDRWGEVAIGAYGFAGTGKAYVFRGSPGGSEPAASWSTVGPQAGSGFGSTVSSAGDVNGDGLSDLLVGAVFEDGPGGPDCGRGHVYLGPLATTSPYTQFAGPSIFANMGHAVASGDVNGDGFGDLVFGEPRIAQTQFDEGGFELYLGNLGVGRPRPAHLSRPFFGGVPVGLYGTSTSISQIGVEALGASAGGRDRVAVEWSLESAFGTGASSRGRSVYVMMGAPTDPLGGSIAFGPVAGGLSAWNPYAWRTRIQARSPYFRFGNWFSPQQNARGQWDFWTASSQSLDAPSVPASGGEGLSRARPNPLVSVTRFEFTVAKGGTVSLVVRDVTGRVVRRLAEGWRVAGSYPGLWDGKDEAGASCSPGLYFLDLRLDGKRFSQRVSVVR